MPHTYINWISARTITGKYGEFYKLSINLEKLKEHQNEKGWVNLLMNKRKEVGQYGETHSFTLDEYKPKQENQQNWSKENWGWELPDDLGF